MAEYIEREAVRNAILGEHPDLHYPSWYANIIDSIPTADVAPVVHGEWRENGLNGFAYALICSKCGYIDGYPFNDNSRYCPNCGAKMDGGVSKCD